MRATILLAVSSTIAGPWGAGEGLIDGIVVNATRDPAPAAGAEVVLRARVEGQFIPMAETVADRQGIFRFEHLLTGGDRLYLPGANRDDVHYPGPRVQLTAQRPRAHVKLVVFDSISHPSPLVVGRHDIIVRAESGVLHVTESMLVENPSSTCYVGRGTHEGKEPVTLSLAIPSDFVRTTFDKEFFGRQFSLLNDKLVTGIPWPPGKRELRFTYAIANDKSHFTWQRSLDLPCAHVRLTVQTNSRDEVSCNLEPARIAQEGEAIFESDGDVLPAGHVIRLQLGHLPVPMMVYGRWISLTVLVGLIAGVSIVIVRRRHHVNGNP